MVRSAPAARLFARVTNPAAVGYAGARHIQTGGTVGTARFVRRRSAMILTMTAREAVRTQADFNDCMMASGWKQVAEAQ